MSCHKQGTKDIFRTFASFIVQIVMADNMFKTTNNNCCVSGEWSFSVKLSQNKVKQTSILQVYLVLNVMQTSRAHSGRFHETMSRITGA